MDSTFSPLNHVNNYNLTWDKKKSENDELHLLYKCRSIRSIFAKFDKRAKTKALIITSALALAHKNNLLNVSVSDIVKRSRINRKTFYRYFTDQPALITTIEDNVIRSIKRAHAKLYRFRNFKTIFKQRDPRQELFRFLDTFGKNRQIILLLTGRHGDPMFSYHLQVLIQKMLFNTQSHFSIDLGTKDQPLFIHYFA